MNILHIDASASDAATSHSRRLSADLVAKLKAKAPDATVTRRDVVAERLPHVDMTIRQAWAPDAENDAGLAETGRRSRGLVEELKAADTIVIGTPMYNFTVPSTLKAWIDHIAIAGQTFSYTETGPKGLLEGKKVYLVLSSGGVYSQGPAQPLDFLDTYLRAVLGFLGLTDVTTIRAEGVAMGPDVEADAMKNGAERIEALVAA